MVWFIIFMVCLTVFLVYRAMAHQINLTLRLLKNEQIRRQRRLRRVEMIKKMYQHRKTEVEQEQIIEQSMAPTQDLKKILESTVTGS